VNKLKKSLETANFDADNRISRRLGVGKEKPFRLAKRNGLNHIRDASTRIAVSEYLRMD
jgi:hypothetical protein